MAGLARSLIDKSALEQRHRSPEALVRINELARQRRLLFCEMVILEVLYSVRHVAERTDSLTWLSEFTCLAVTNEVMRRAIEVQGMLTHIGHHRVSPPDLIIAATAELNGAVLLHYDKDYDVIASVTGQPTRWIIPRGSGG